MVTDNRTVREKVNMDDEFFDLDDEESQNARRESDLVFAGEELLEGTNEFINEALLGHILIILP